MRLRSALAAAALAATALASPRDTPFSSLAAHRRFQEAFAVQKGEIDLLMGEHFLLRDLRTKTQAPDAMTTSPLAATARSRAILVTRPDSAIVWDAGPYYEANRSGKLLFDARHGALASSLDGEVQRYASALRDAGFAEGALYASKMTAEASISLLTSFGSGAVAKLATKPFKKLTHRELRKLEREAAKAVGETLAPELYYAIKARLNDNGTIATDTDFKELMYGMLSDGLADLRAARSLVERYRTQPAFTPDDAAELRAHLLLGFGRTRAASIALAHHYPGGAQGASNFLLHELAPTIASGATPLTPATFLVDYERLVSNPSSDLAAFQKKFDEEAAWFDAQYGELAAWAGVDSLHPLLSRARTELEGGYATPEALVSTAFLALQAQDWDAFSASFSSAETARRHYTSSADRWLPRTTSRGDTTILEVTSWTGDQAAVQEWRVRQDADGYWRIASIRSLPAPQTAAPPAVPPTPAPALGLTLSALTQDPAFRERYAISSKALRVQDRDGTVYALHPLFQQQLPIGAAEPPAYLAVTESGFAVDDPAALERLSFAASLALRARSGELGTELTGELRQYQQLLAVDAATDDAAYLQSRLRSLLAGEWQPAPDAAPSGDSMAILSLLPDRSRTALAKSLETATQDLSLLRDRLAAFSASETISYKDALHLSSLIRQAKGASFAAALGAYGPDPTDSPAYAASLNRRMDALEALLGPSPTARASASVVTALSASAEERRERAEAEAAAAAASLRRQFQPQPAQPLPSQPLQPQRYSLSPDQLAAFRATYETAMRTVDDILKNLEWAYVHDPGSGVTADELRTYQSMRSDLRRYEKVLSGASLTEQEHRDFQRFLERLPLR